MNFQMNYFQILLLFSIFAFAYSLEHDVFVRFSSKHFEPVKGYLKIIIHRANSKRVFELNRDV